MKLTWWIVKKSLLYSLEWNSELCKHIETVRLYSLGNNKMIGSFYKVQTILEKELTDQIRIQVGKLDCTNSSISLRRLEMRNQIYSLTQLLFCYKTLLELTLLTWLEVHHWYTSARDQYHVETLRDTSLYFNNMVVWGLESHLTLFNTSFIIVLN